ARCPAAAPQPPIPPSMAYHSAAAAGCATTRGAALAGRDVGARGIGNDVLAIGADVLTGLAQQGPLAVGLADFGSQEMRCGQRLGRAAGGGVGVASAVGAPGDRLIGRESGKDQSEKKSGKRQGFVWHARDLSIQSLLLPQA